jgi:two-component system phosphate regulon response regulator PhoB
MAARLGTSILVVEDEPAIQELLRLSLGDAGFDVHAVADAEGAHAEIRRALPDLVLLDWMLPGQSGLALARTLRADARTRELPIIMLTARGDETDRIAGLGPGRRLRDRRSRASCRRGSSRCCAGAHPKAQDMLSIGALRDPAAHRVTAAGATVDLGPTEFRLLKFLMARPDRVHTRTQLLDQVWGDHVYIEERTIDVHIRRLRLALEPHGQEHMIETVRGTGYRLAAAKRP